MSNSEASRASIRSAAHAVVEYATVSFRPEFLLWDKSVNLGVAELVWNAYSAGLDTHCPEPASSPLAELYERLDRVRRLRWGDERVLVLGLDVRHEDGDILFTFDLTWDEGHTFHPCEIAWDFLVAGPDGQQAAESGTPFLNLS